MNPIDVALVFLLLLCAVRGFWRGFIRESFGFLALLVGVGAALRFADGGAALLAAEFPQVELSATARLGIAFVAIFVVVSTSINVFGLLCDRFLLRGALRGASRVGGAVFAVGKGAVVLAFILLFFRLFPVVQGLDQRITDSRIARPMISLADSMLRVGWSNPAPEGSQA